MRRGRRESVFVSHDEVIEPLGAPLSVKKQVCPGRPIWFGRISITRHPKSLCDISSNLLSGAARTRPFPPEHCEDRSECDDRDHRCGHTGSALAQHLFRAGEEVALAALDKSAPEALAEKLGPLARADSVDGAIARADTVIFAVWLEQMEELIANPKRGLKARSLSIPPTRSKSSSMTTRRISCARFP
jgi:hypothetical protein